MITDFSQFRDMEFPTQGNIVYVLYFLKSADSNWIPFYVGETSRNVGRVGDYLSAKFSAPTDFKVGEAVKCLRSRGLHVGVKYKESGDPKNEEKRVLGDLRGRFRLLNDLPGYNYKRSKMVDEKLRIHDFIRQIIENPFRSERSTDVSGKATDANVNETNAPTATEPTRDRDSTIPERVKTICEKLGKGGKTIRRRDIVRLAGQTGIKESSVLPADYCDNTATGKWSKHKFLHSVGAGTYVLLSSPQRRGTK